MYQPFDLPAMNLPLRKVSEQSGIKTFFTIWEGVLQAGYGKTSEEEKCVIFTVSDDEFKDLVKNHRGFEGERPTVDPFLLDPVLQRLVLACQLVKGELEVPLVSEFEVQHLTTVGGRTIQLTRDKDGTLFANGVKLKRTFTSDASPGCTLFLMEKILWIRPEDIEIGIVRLTE